MLQRLIRNSLHLPVLLLPRLFPQSILLYPLLLQLLLATLLHQKLMVLHTILMLRVRYFVCYSKSLLTTNPKVKPRLISTQTTTSAQLESQTFKRDLKKSPRPNSPDLPAQSYPFCRRQALDVSCGIRNMMLVLRLCPMRRQVQHPKLMTPMAWILRSQWPLPMMMKRKT